MFLSPIWGKKKIFINVTPSKIQEVTTSLISVGPIAGSSDGSESNGEESTSFTADDHAHHFEEIFSKLFSRDISRWLICQTVDNTNVNKKISELLRVPHVGCSSYKLNLEATRLVSNDYMLSSTLSYIHDTMIDFKTKFKSRVFFRNLTPLNRV